MDPKLKNESFPATIRRLALCALRHLPKRSAAYRDARVRKNKPMDYLRCVEFPLAHRQLSLTPGMKVLDIASPQWFSLSLAYWHPDVDFHYVNILEEELDLIRKTAECLGLRNIVYSLADCRSLDFKNCSFDRVVSLSVIEHIDPDIGGDILSLKEIHRTLKDGGELVLSVPLKDTASLVYDDHHPVWEKPAQKNNFYMRNYDMAQFERLARETGFGIKQKALMFERAGLFALEYWEGGPGKSHASKNRVMRLKKKLDKLMSLRLEGFLAKTYLRLEEKASPSDRLINIVATFSKKPS